jgi:hypothetical protein
LSGGRTWKVADWQRTPLDSAGNGIAINANTTVNLDNMLLLPDGDIAFQSQGSGGVNAGGGSSSTNGGFAYRRGTQEVAFTEQAYDINNGTLIMSAKLTMWSTTYRYSYVNTSTKETELVNVNFYQKPYKTTTNAQGETIPLVVNGEIQFEATAQHLTESQLDDWCEVVYSTIATSKYYKGPRAKNTNGDKIPLERRYTEALGFALSQASTKKTIRFNANRAKSGWLSVSATNNTSVNGWLYRAIPTDRMSTVNWDKVAYDARYFVHDNRNHALDSAFTMYIKVEITNNHWRFWISDTEIASNAAPNYEVDDIISSYETIARAKDATAPEGESRAYPDGVNNLPDLKNDGLVVPSIVCITDGIAGGADPITAGGAFVIEDIYVNYIANVNN